jgi:hypothetical protein
MVRSVFGGDVNNTVNTRGVYPEASGATLGERGGALTPYTSGSYKAAGVLNSFAADSGGRTVVQDDASDANTGEGGGILAKPFSWWIVLAVLLVALMWAAQRFGSQSEEFHSIKLSIYNVFIVALASIIGIGFFKMVFGRFQVPGLTPFIAAI